MKLFRMIYIYVKKYKLYLIMFISFNIIISLLSIITPYVSGKYIDTLVKAKTIKEIYFFTSIILIISFLNISISYVNNIVSTKLQTNITFELNYHIIEHMKKLPLLYYNNTNTAYLNQRINTDSNIVVSFILSNLITIVVKAASIFLYIYILIKINLKISLLLLFLVPLYLVCYFGFKKPLFRYSYELKEEQSIFFSKMNEQLFNIRFIKLNASFSFIRKKYIQSFAKLFKIITKYTKMSYLFSSIDVFGRIEIKQCGS